MTEVKEYDGIKYYKLRQKKDDIYIYGKTIIVSVKDGVVQFITGDYNPNIIVNESKVMYSRDIEAKIYEKYGSNIEIDSLEKYLLEDGNFIYYVSIINGIEYVDLIIDAYSGEIISERNLHKHVKEVNAFELEGNDSRKYNINLEKTSIKGIYNFYDEQRNIKVINAVNYGMDPSALLIPNTPIVINIDDKDKSSQIYKEYPNIYKDAVTAQANMAIIYDYYKDNFGYKGLQGKNKEIIINLGIKDKMNIFGEGKEIANASYLPLTNEFYFGSYNSKSMADYLDIIAHEYTHSVINDIVDIKDNIDNKNLNYSGAIDEAYSDLFGLLIQGGDFIVESGEIEDYLGRDIANPERYEKPSKVNGEFYYPNYYIKDGETLDDMLQKNNYEVVSDYDNGGKHHNSTVVSHTIYTLLKEGVINNTKDLSNILYSSMFYLPSDANFEDCAISILITLETYNYSKDKIEQAREIFYESGMLQNKITKLTGKVLIGDKIVKNALIEFVNTDSVALGYKVYTDNKGEYFVELPLGEYLVSIENKKNGNFYDNIFLEKNKENKDFYLEKEVTKEEINVVFHVDNSGSMLSCEDYKKNLTGLSAMLYDCSENNNDPDYLRIDFIKEMMLVINRYNANIKLTAFTGNLYNLVDWTKDGNQIMEALPRIRTEQYEYNGTVFSEDIYNFALSMDKNKNNNIILLTDGNETSDISLSDKNLEEINGNNVKVNIVCLGNCN